MGPNRTAAALVAAGIAVAMAACGGKGPTAPTSDSPAQSVEIGVAGGGEAVAAPGGTLQLWARTHDKDGGTTDITNVAIWQSSDPAVATVDRSGLVTVAKTGAVTISAAFSKYSGTLPLTIVACIATAPPRIVYNARGGYGTLTVTMSRSDCRWSASSTDSPWLSVYPSQSASGSGPLNYSVQVNNTPDPRTGTIKIDVPDGRGTTVTIAQDKPSCSMVLTPAARTVPAEGGAFTVDLAVSPATCEWYVSAYEGGNLKITGPRSGRGDATLSYTMSRNTFPYTPMYSIEVYPTLNDSPPARHTITQLR